MNSATSTEEDYQNEAVQAKVRQFERGCGVIPAAISELPIFEQIELLPEDFAKEAEAFNEERSRLIDRAQQLAAPIREALADLEKGESSHGAVVAAAEQVKFDRIELLERAVPLADQCHDLFSRSVDLYKANADKAATERDGKLVEVKQALTDIGQGAEATQAGRRGTLGETADHQLTFLARSNQFFVPLEHKAQRALSTFRNANDRTLKAAKCKRSMHNLLTETTLGSLSS